MFLDKSKQLLKFMYFGLKNKIKESPLYWRTLIILFFIALIVKWVIIYFSYRNLNPWENVISYIASDIIIIFFSHLLVTINYWIKKRKFRLINDFIVFIVLLLYIIDMFTIFVFHSRVAIIDIFALWSNGSSWFDWIIRLRILIFIITWLLVFFLTQSKLINSKKSWKNIFISLSICSVIYAIFYAVIIFSNKNFDYVDNILSLNIDKMKEYEPELELEDTPKWYSIKNIKWEWKDLNIILVFAESLSAIDSANIWWNNNMPYFDKIQQEWITFSNFITNWTTSDTAHISTLLGVVPLINMRMENTPYSGYKLKMESLPNFLNSEWYNTTFVSAASLNFLKQRDFLSWAWFQKIIWEEEFKNNKKYTFESAPDGELYDRVLEEVKAQTWKYFIWLQTISFHKPYNTPLGKTESLALQYSDEELFKFYEGLKWIWFFDNWILVIVWDHRKMNPVEEWESDIFGPNRYTRSVATVVWSWINSWAINTWLVQHTDFYSSLKRLVWHWLVEVDSIYNDIFTQEANRDWWITNSEFYENNRYTVSSNSWDIFLFKNISNLTKDSPIYDYFSSYVSFEFGNNESDSNNLENNIQNNKIKIIWHRWAIQWHPENTLEAFLAANELWADWVEFDVSYTKDQENVVVHWDLLYASNCKRQKIWNLNFEWIQKNCTIKNWEKYMKLQKMLELIDWFFDYYFLEIKVYDENLWAQQALDAIQTVKNLNMQDRVIFISYSNSAREVLDSDPDIIYWWDSFDINDLDFIWENNSKYFLAPYDILTPEIVEKAKSLWKEVATYTVNETWDFQSMKDMGINIIMTDELELLQDWENKIHHPISHNFEILKLKKSLKD